MGNCFPLLIYLLFYCSFLLFSCNTSQTPIFTLEVRPTQLKQAAETELQYRLENLHLISDGYVVVSKQFHTIYRLDNGLNVVWKYR